VHAAAEAVRFEKGKDSAAAVFPEFRAWHALLEPLFGITPEEWVEAKPAQGVFASFFEEEEPEERDEESGDEE